MMMMMTVKSYWQISRITSRKLDVLASNILFKSILRIRVSQTWLQVSYVSWSWYWWWVNWQLENNYVNVCDDYDVINWQLNVWSNSWKWWVTNELTVEEWCGSSDKVKRLDLEILVSVKSKKESSQCLSTHQPKVFN